MADDLWTLDDAHLDRALAAVAHNAIRTPLVPAPAFGTRVFLKLETEQHTGSFKVRGALAKLASLDEERRRLPVVAASAGNHGLGVAYAARILGLAARVHVPEGTPLVKRNGMAALGATVVVTPEPGYDAAERAARADAQQTGGTFVSPFDDPHVAAGNGGTLGLEILGAMASLSAVVAPVGGGGLMAGLGAARSRAGKSTRLIGVQSHACPAMARSLEQGAPILEMRGEPTLAEGLEGGVSASTFALVRDAVERIDLVSEEEIAAAMTTARDRMGLVTEGSAATVLAWAIKHLGAEPGTDPVVLVVTGRNVELRPA